jgi:phage tail sheath protein FI
MPNYKTPGVYVEELPADVRSIESVSTSTACFIGTGGKADAPIGEPTAITNWTQFQTMFMGDGPMTPLAHAVNGFFANTQGRCYILDIGPNGRLTGTAQSPGLSVLEAIGEIAIVAAPGCTDAEDYDAIISHCEAMGDRVAILDAPRDVPDPMALTRVATVDAPTDSPSAGGQPAGEPGQPPPGPRRPAALAPRPTDFAALYHPWVSVTDLNTGEAVLAPPSGHMAGIWARTDATRGVQKAPANVAMRGVNGVRYRVAPSEQGELNEAGVNVIRMIGNLGIRPWGARTLAGSTKPEMRYINVRRLFCMVEESIAQGTSWIVFEPNDRELWSMMVRDLKAFLTGLWRDGALMGRTPEEAFIIKCDDETNPPDSVDRGLVVAMIWLAPVKPAEFVVFKVSQFSGGTIVEEGNIRA